MGVLGFLSVSVTVRIGNEQTIKCSPWFGLIIGKNKKKTMGQKERKFI